MLTQSANKAQPVLPYRTSNIEPFKHSLDSAL